MLKVNPEERPSCEELLKNPSIPNKPNIYPESPIPTFKNDCNKVLLDTIALPKNLNVNFGV